MIYITNYGIDKYGRFYPNYYVDNDDIVNETNDYQKIIKKYKYVFDLIK